MVDGFDKCDQKNKKVKKCKCKICENVVERKKLAVAD